MKKLLSILFLFASLKTFAGNLVTGSGSGAVNVTSQGSLTPGDTIKVVAGIYGSYSTFSNISGSPGHYIVIIPQSGANTVLFSGGVNLVNAKYIVVQGFEGSGAGWDMKGNNNNAGGLTGVSNVYFHNMHFKNMTGYAFNNHNNVVYNYTSQDTLNLASYKVKWDSITLDNCGGMIRGSFGTVGNGIDLCLNDTVTRILVNDVQGNGSVFIGIQFRSSFSFVTVKQTTWQPYAADQGVFTFGGGGNGFSGTIHDVYINGPVSVWIARLNIYALFGSSTDSCLVYNVQATNKSSFGGVVIQSLAGDLIAGKVASCNAGIFNISLGNCPTLNTFWNYTLDCGSGLHSQTVHAKNLIGFNNAFTNKTPGVIIDESSGSAPTYDTSNNIYGANAFVLGLDETGTWPTYAPYSTSALVGSGVATPYTTGGQLDLAGVAWNSPPSKGPYKVSANTVPTPFTPTQISGGAADIRNFGRGAVETNGFGTMDNITSVEVPAGFTNALDYEYRFAWWQIEGTTANSYSWTLFDQQIQHAINLGQRFSFSVMPICSSCGTDAPGGVLGMKYPLYLHTAMQAEAVTDYHSNSGLWIPNWNSPTYLARLQALYTAILLHINSSSFNGILYSQVVNRVGVRGYGDFGEWHNFPYYNEAGYATRVATSATLKTIIDIAANTFTNYPVQIAVGSFDGGSASLTPADVTYYALTKTNNFGPLGWERDNLGDPNTDGLILSGNPGSYNPGTGSVSFAPLIMARYKTSPVGGEPNNAVGSTGSPYADLGAEVAKAHLSYFRNYNYGGNSANNATVQANVIAASKASGYRLTINGGSRTPSPTTGGSWNITTHWQNNGLAPSYEKWNVIYELRNGATVIWRDTSHFQPKLFYGSFLDTTISDTYTFSSVAAGTYALYVIVKDPLAYKTPMSLAITGRGADGSYQLATGIVVSATSAPVAFAGNDQAITLPVSTVTLDGTGSSGTISSYLWTKFSGPASGTITTPTTATTTVTGLTAGTYVYKLSLNAGVSTDTMTVVVNPSVPPSPTIFSTQTPIGGTGNDGPQIGGTVGIETGVKFRSNLPGYILGVRFYKTSGNTGTHVGELYNSTGTRLATATFGAETLTGWQTVSFSPAIAIAANTTYIAAYFSPVGNYVSSNNYFTAAVVNTNLSALADGTDGPNGLFRYTDTNIVPNSNFQKSNYWVDIVFSIDPPSVLTHLAGRKIAFKKVGP